MKRYNRKAKAAPLLKDQLLRMHAELRGEVWTTGITAEHAKRFGFAKKDLPKLITAGIKAGYLERRSLKKPAFDVTRITEAGMTRLKAIEEE